MKIIVTGGAGFIGSNFIYYMMEKHSEDQIICLDALTYAGAYVNPGSSNEKSSVPFCESICDGSGDCIPAV